MLGVNTAVAEYGYGDLNQGVFTAMSYNRGYSGAAGLPPIDPCFGAEAGPMALDIVVLQTLYGVNTSHAGGRDFYLLPDTNAPGTAWQAIWDTGGNDLLCYDGDRDATLDLRAATLVYGPGGGGFVSAAAGIAGGYTIAAGVVIEAARGGGGADRINRQRGGQPAGRARWRRPDRWPCGQ